LSKGYSFTLYSLFFTLFIFFVSCREAARFIKEIKICRDGFMLLIAGAMTTIGQTRPHPLSIFRSFLSIGLVKDIKVAGGVGQVCTEVNFRFGLVA
jgi:hypothetical protein